MSDSITNEEIQDAINGVMIASYTMMPLAKIYRDRCSKEQIITLCVRISKDALKGASKTLHEAYTGGYLGEETYANLKAAMRETRKALRDLQPYVRKPKRVKHKQEFEVPSVDELTEQFKKEGFDKLSEETE